MLKKLFGVGMISGVVLSGCGESTGITALAPGEEAGAPVSLVVGPIVTETVEETNADGTTRVTITYPESADVGDEVMATATIEFSDLRRAEIDAEVTGPGFEITPSFTSFEIGCPLVGFTRCDLEFTFVVPPEASRGSTYFFNATVTPVAVRGGDPPAVFIAGEARVNP